MGCEIGSSQPGSIDDKKLLLQDEIFGDEGLRTARPEQLGNRGQDVGEKQEKSRHGGRG